MDVGPATSLNSWCLSCSKQPSGRLAISQAITLKLRPTGRGCDVQIAEAG